jgi:hypothetical protein
MPKFNPKLLRFVTCHSHSVLYRIMDPRLRSCMAAAKVWWNRYQLQPDLEIAAICSKLRRAGHISGQIVDKNHITNVVLHNRTVPISHPEDFVEVFGPQEISAVMAIVQEIIPSAAAPPDQEPDNLPVAPAAVSDQNSMDVETDTMEHLLDEVAGLSTLGENIVTVSDAELSDED